MEKTERLSLNELEGIVHRCEAALFAGTSSHKDVVQLVDAEREIQRRQRRHLEEATKDSRASGSGATDSGGWSLT